MRIDIYSDIVCPWCYVGERRFARALEAFEAAPDVEVRFRPFQLDPAAPEEAEPLAEYLNRRYGAVSDTMQDRVGAVAREEGIAIDWARALAANTRHAHRLVRLAELEGGPETQRALVQRLFALHFERGGDLTDFGQLEAEAGAVGLEAGRARSYLESGEGAAELEVEFQRARELGVGSVPTFVFEGQWVVEGAQPTETFLSALREVAAADDA